MKKAIIITGPTATGKTALALKIAQKINGALISVDSIQVYKDCNIISGKDIPQKAKFHKETISKKLQNFQIGYWDINGTPLFLTDIIDSDYDFNLTDFIRVCKLVLKEVEKKGKTPVFVGGSTLYTRALITPIETAHIPPNKTLRKKLIHTNVEELQQALSKLDPTRLKEMNSSDVKNSRRLIRAIEIANWNITHKRNKKETIDDYNFIIFALNTSREKLKKRIINRVKKRIREGAFKEVNLLNKKNHKLSSNIKVAVGYKQLLDFENKKTSKEEAIESWINSEFQYAKKQTTYFKKIKHIKWRDIDDKNYPNNIIFEAEEFIS